MPSSPKLKTESTISCASFAISSTPLTASVLYAASFALSCAASGAVPKDSANMTSSNAIARLIDLVLLLRRRSRRADRRVLDAELIQVGLVLRRIVVILLHLLAVLLEDVLVEMRGRRRVLLDEGDVLHVLGLDVVEVIPRRLDELGLGQQIENGHRLHL